jgi:GDPmannose 4,6-dehydratase
MTKPEKSPFTRAAPYACSKVYSFYQMINFVKKIEYKLQTGYLFHHVSTLRGETFLIRKITRAVGRISMGIQS